uniref:Uncharacterized protein n=1 Tax=Prevotella sp. GTC17260 TaxID=3236796 RepID=A0AB33JF58_9BACT
MSLDTVLKIGEALRNSDDYFKHFSYVKPCPVGRDGEGLISITIPVKRDMSFAWEDIYLTPEKEINNLFYLTFKTSDSDTSGKYIFGDIYYTRTGNIDKIEGGYYKINKGRGKSSFEAGRSDAMLLLDDSDMIKRFREAFERNLNKIEILLNYAPAIEKGIAENNVATFLAEDINSLSDNMLCINRTMYKKQRNKWIGLKDSEQDEIILKQSRFSVFVHFDFLEVHYWYKYIDIFNLISDKILQSCIVKSAKGLCLIKSLYKTIGSGDKKNDVQFPNFSRKNRFKIRSFSEQELYNLFYAINYAKFGKLIQGTEINHIVLPRGHNLKADDFLKFKDNRMESAIKQANTSIIGHDVLFDFSPNMSKNITSFDVIFSKKGNVSAPDYDLIEISGLDVSKLKLTQMRIHDIAGQVFEKDLLGYVPSQPILESFQNIFQNKKKGSKNDKGPDKKYQSHLLKVLPCIYTDSYNGDKLLLSTFIEKVEFTVREGEAVYNRLKYYLKFLLSIQNSKCKQNNYMETVESKSYQIGCKFGKLSKPLKKAIGSFEKRYVGMLSRHIMTKDDCEKLVVEIQEMLLRHGKQWEQKAAEAISELVALPIKEYDKEKFAIGFFEGYFTYEEVTEKSKMLDKLQKIISDYSSKEDFKSECDILSKALSELKTVSK